MGGSKSGGLQGTSMLLCTQFCIKSCRTNNEKNNGQVCWKVILIEVKTVGRGQKGPSNCLGICFFTSNGGTFLGGGRCGESGVPVEFFCK